MRSTPSLPILSGSWRTVALASPAWIALSMTGRASKPTTATLPVRPFCLTTEAAAAAPGSKATKMALRSGLAVRVFWAN